MTWLRMFPRMSLDKNNYILFGLGIIIIIIIIIIIKTYCETNRLYIYNNIIDLGLCNLN